MSYPKGRVALKKAAGGYDVVFSTCGLRGAIGATDITVTELPSQRPICKLDGVIVHWWRYGEPVAGKTLWPERCVPLQAGKTYEIIAHGWTIVEIDAAGEPRVIDASCEDLLES